MEIFLIEFAAWFQKNGVEEIIVLDGKRLKGNNIHLLHALATRCGIVSAQINIHNKKNESTEIPAMLEKLNIEDAIITADALNCQKAIAEKIREKQAHYFLVLKGNQGTLFEDAQSYFLSREKMEYHEEINKEHGRLEVRRCWSTDKIEWLKKEHSDWKNLKSICYIERERYIKGLLSKGFALYITSTDAVASKHLHYSRQHWGVENKLH